MQHRRDLSPTFLLERERERERVLVKKKKGSSQYAQGILSALLELDTSIQNCENGGKDGTAVPEVNADDSHNWSSELSVVFNTKKLSNMLHAFALDPVGSGFNQEIQKFLGVKEVGHHKQLLKLVVALVL
ncbi:hypothetical protein LWI28_005992 [Acer negundo]|uniref:Uncharacterized protein n=1 Tax=Acer negundo TaxID=4023 RepID=A0AAD5I8K5_ACENE|nr:hypothetical protein LWI28_005992 [Acer negundo]